MTATLTPPLAALTTIFTPPCPTSWLLTQTKAPSQFPSFPTGPASCDPPSWNEYITNRGFEYYSPAICPFGFSIGPSCVITSANTAQGFPAIQADETAAYCVPTGHTCTTDTSDFRGGVWGALQTNTAKGVAMTVGPAIQIRWRDSDLSTLETDPLTPGLAPSQAESTTSIPVVRATTISVVATRSSSSSESLTSLVPPISSTSSSKFVVINTIGRPTSTSIQTSTTLSMTEVRLSTNELPSTSSAPSPSITTPPQNGGSNSTDSSTSASDSKSRSPQTSNFTVAAITLTTILITILLLYAAHSTLRQYRRYRSGSKENAPVFIFLFTIPSRVSRVSRKLSDLSRSIPTRLYNLGVALLVAIRRQRPRHGPKCPEKAISELEATSPPSELGTGDPVGSKDNPAELATSDSRSFMSRVSRMFTVRSRRSSTSTSSTIFPRASMAVTVGVAVPVAVSRPLPPLPTEIPAVPGIPPSFTNTPAVRIVSTTSRSGRSVSAADAIR